MIVILIMPMNKALCRQHKLTPILIGHCLTAIANEIDEELAEFESG